MIPVTRAHPLYPASLCDLPDPPPQIEIVGSLPALDRAVAIVGTRSPDPRAERLARTLAQELAQAGCVIVSGGALGIDTAAHLGALDAGGLTIAVLPLGLGRPYPARNIRLFERVVERGCVLSELSGDVVGYPSRFLARNRLVAALTHVTVVAQAPFGSGALSTAAHANRLGRPVLAVPYAPWDLRGQGCLDLVARGARICRTSADVLTLAVPRGATRLPKNTRRPKKAERFHGLDEDQRAVAEALVAGPLDADELCEQSRLTAPRVQRAILMLLLSKVIQEVGSGGYALADYP